MSFSGTKRYITKPKPGVMLNPLHPLSKGLVGYWLFNEGAGSLANDISGNKNHGTLKNASPNVQGSGWGESKFGGGLQFDGVDDHVEIDDDVKLTLSSGGTWELWMRKSTLITSNTTIIDKYQSPNLEWVGIQHASLLKFLVYDSVNSGYIGRTGPGISSNVTHHIVFTYDGGTVASSIKIYVDGIKIDNADMGSGTFISMRDTIEPVRIGSDSTAIAVYFKGFIDQVRIYNRALLVEEIKQLYQDPFCNLLQVPIRRYSVAAPPVGAIMNQFQRTNIGADLYNGVFA